MEKAGRRCATPEGRTEFSPRLAPFSARPDSRRATGGPLVLPPTRAFGDHSKQASIHSLTSEGACEHPGINAPTRLGPPKGGRRGGSSSLNTQRQGGLSSDRHRLHRMLRSQHGRLGSVGMLLSGRQGFRKERFRGESSRASVENLRVWPRQSAS